MCIQCGKPDDQDACYECHTRHFEETMRHTAEDILEVPRDSLQDLKSTHWSEPNLLDNMKHNQHVLEEALKKKREK